MQDYHEKADARKRAKMCLGLIVLAIVGAVLAGIGLIGYHLYMKVDKVQESLKTDVHFPGP